MNAGKVKVKWGLPPSYIKIIRDNDNIFNWLWAISTFRPAASLLFSFQKHPQERIYFVVTEWNLPHCICMARSMANPYIPLQAAITSRQPVISQTTKKPRVLCCLLWFTWLFADVGCKKNISKDGACKECGFYWRIEDERVEHFPPEKLL